MLILQSQRHHNPGTLQSINWWLQLITRSPPPPPNTWVCWDRKMFLRACCNVCHQCQSHFSSFCSFDGFQLALSANGIHVPSWPHSQNTVNTFQGNLQLFLDRKSQRKGAEKTKTLKKKKRKQFHQFRDVDFQGAKIVSDSDEIKITDVLRNCYKLLEVPR